MIMRESYAYLGDRFDIKRYRNVDNENQKILEFKFASFPFIVTGKLIYTRIFLFTFKCTRFYRSRYGVLVFRVPLFLALLQALQRCEP